MAANFPEEILVQLTSQFWRSGINEAGTATFSAIAVQRELADGQDCSPDIGEGSVHLSGIVFKDAQSHHFLSDDNDIITRVLRAHSQEYQKPPPNGSGDFSGDTDFGLSHSLDDGSHGCSVSDVDRILNWKGGQVPRRSVCGSIRPGCGPAD